MAAPIRKFSEPQVAFDLDTLKSLVLQAKTPEEQPFKVPPPIPPKPDYLKVKAKEFEENLTSISPEEDQDSSDEDIVFSDDDEDFYNKAREILNTVWMCRDTNKPKTTQSGPSECSRA